mgnify:CR=1 FL=1
MKTITEVPAPTSPAHTPGPWTILPNTPHFVRAMHPAEGMQPVATVYHFDGELAANARLIAAAPELLAALAGCADALREAGKDFAQANKLAARPNLYELHERSARAAIAKAKGGEK